MDPPPRATRPRQAVGAFLNIPYDAQFENLYIAYIAGLCACGLVPRSALEVPSGGSMHDRIVRILSILRQCPYSLHDLSRVQLHRIAPRTPRFNMPFELGMAAAWAETAKNNNHTWFVFEAQAGRLAKSLSDLRGVDEFVHDGTVSGLFGCLNNAFVRRGHRTTIDEVQSIYRDLRKALPLICRHAGAKSAFESRVFSDLVVAAGISARNHISWLRS
jgi:hypothetical protein